MSEPQTPSGPRTVRFTIVMEATYEIDPSSPGYGVETLEEAAEIDRHNLLAEDIYLSLEAMGADLVDVSWQDVTDGGVSR